MSSKSGSSHESFTATWTITDVVSDCSMGTFDMVVQMRHSKERLFAVVVCALENSFVIVGS